MLICFHNFQFFSFLFCYVFHNFPFLHFTLSTSQPVRWGWKIVYSINEANEE